MSIYHYYQPVTLNLVGKKQKDYSHDDQKIAELNIERLKTPENNHGILSTVVPENTVNVDRNILIDQNKVEPIVRDKNINKFDSDQNDSLKMVGTNPPYAPLVSSSTEEDDDALNSSSVVPMAGHLNGPINCQQQPINIVRTRPKKSFRTSFMMLFKSCFGNGGPMMMRIMSALFFAISSFLIVVVNKIVLTTYHFPSVMILGLGQVVATIVILNIARRMNVIKFPYYSREIHKKVFPLPFFYLGNLVSGLGSTKRLNLPMLTVLRRFTILMTMIGEYYLLGVNQSMTIKMTVFMMIGGAIIAASNDLAFDAIGYVYVLLNDIFSTFNGVYMKKKLDSRDLGKYGILYYNAIFIVVPLFIISMCVDDWRQCFLEFEHWRSPLFVMSFLLSCIMGFVLMYSTALCTQHNSALTTTIVGCLKNILVTFIGMYVGGDYIFSYVNFIGLNISMIGSLIYSYVIFVHQKSPAVTVSSTDNAGKLKNVEK